ncbi:MAG: hypothetical protein AABW80_00710 [Nanoarchaeota archaeon]
MKQLMNKQAMSKNTWITTIIVLIVLIVAIIMVISNSDDSAVEEKSSFDDEPISEFSNLQDSGDDFSVLEDSLNNFE